MLLITDSRTVSVSSKSAQYFSYTAFAEYICYNIGMHMLYYNHNLTLNAFVNKTICRLQR